MSDDGLFEILVDDGVIGDQTGASVSIPKQNRDGSDNMVVAVEIETTGTVTLEGRLTARHSFVELATAINASGIVEVPYVPFIRAVVSASPSPLGNIRVFLRRVFD